MSRERAAAHAGTATAETRPESGLTLAVALPPAQESAQPRHPRAAATEA